MNSSGNAGMTCCYFGDISNHLFTGNTKGSLYIWNKKNDTIFI